LAESLVVENTLSKQKKYDSLLPQILSLISGENNAISLLSNVTAALKQTFDSFSWTGFYFLNENSAELILGPFQGKVACSRLPAGKGVCWEALNRGETLIVNDVHKFPGHIVCDRHKFPGHIVCDSGSNSEIVIPLIYNNLKLGVLDIDSYEFNNFDEVDKLYLEKIMSNLINEITELKIFYNK